ncbi:enterochelin esterase domain-containing protein [Patulibacter minatonensis]|uniref:enterochelin esterase domain-containing protein n=1 Tax=Patulibacter minatonensis TaxID=298163 RepID=UPI0004B54F8D|nr:enterochelin esterase domain-containing protein [Patulibacter minatonensis]
MTAAPRPPRWTKDPPPQVVPSPPVEALAADIAGGVDPATATAAFWAAAEIRGTPLVDRVVGSTGERIVTFLWRDRHGAGDGTRAVVLIANKLTDPSLPAESGLERLQGTDVWWRAFRLSSAWRGTYALAADDGATPVEDATEGPRARWRGLATRAAADVRNPRTFPGNRGAAPLSVLELPDAPPQPHSTLPAGAARGVVAEVRVPTRVPGEVRRAWVHVPATAGGSAIRAAADGTGADGGSARPGAARRTDAAEPHRLLVLLDGDEWTGRRDAPTILDALHHHGLIPPTITLMVDGGGADARTADTVAGAPHLDLLTATLPDWMRERYPVGGGREHLVLAGQSLGGLAVLRAASHAPDRVGAVVAQSSSLWWGGQEAPDAPPPTVEGLRARPPVGVRIHAQVGRDEWVILRSHHALRAALAEAGVEHELHEYEGGHDAFCWRGGLAEGLIRVLGTTSLDDATARPRP